MKKLISVLTVMLILFASVWCMMPVMAAALPVLPDNNTQDVGGCLVHTYNDWSATPTTPTCTVDSYYSRTCTVCGFVDLEKAGSTVAHTIVAGGKYTFNEADASHSYTCSQCKQVVTEECNLVFVSQKEQAECETQIINIFKCSLCEGTVEIPETPAHNVPEWTLVANSVRHSGVCEGCGKTIYEDCVLEVIKETGDCENGGSRTLVCKCGRTGDEVIPAGHNIESWIHIEGTDVHVGKCTTCMKSLNNKCVINGYRANPITAENPDRTHTGTCEICLAEYITDCTPGTYTSVAGTASHQTDCVDCGRNYTGICTPDENGWKAGTNGSHSATCAVCKGAFTNACTPGEFTHVENTETHSATCTVCNGVYTEACEVKNWTPSQKVNAESGIIENADLHKGTCEKCAAEYEKDCTVETYTLDVSGKICTGACTVCGDSVTHNSTLSDWKHDIEKNTHTITCTNCKASVSHDVAVSESGWKHVDAAGESCHEATCKVCETVVLAACEFEKDATNSHKNTCKVCTYSYENECESFAKDKENSTASTCTKDGYTYYVCTECGKRNDEKTLVHKAIGHDFVVDEDAEITAGDESHTVTRSCKNCSETETVTEEHTFGKAKAEKNGKHSYTCTVCGKTKTEDCKAVKVPAVAATCTKGGLTEGSKCSVCDAVLKEQTETSATGHDFKYHSTTATCSKAGKDIFKCVCGETKEVEAAANGKHNWKATSRVPATAEANGYVEYTCRECAETYREVLVYSVHTGVSSAMTPVAAIVLLSGAAFLGVRKLRKEEE